MNITGTAICKGGVVRQSPTASMTSGKYFKLKKVFRGIKYFMLLS